MQNAESRSLLPSAYCLLRTGCCLLKSRRGKMRGFRDLKVYQLAYKLAMEIFIESKSFPIEERYSLTDQIRRSSRSVTTNIAEGFRKRRYPNMFVSKMADADSEATETQVWLDFANDCGYLSKKRHDELINGYEDVGKMLGSMIAAPEKFKTQ
jgi:four helix bundle protein